MAGAVLEPDGPAELTVHIERRDDATAEQIAAAPRLLTREIKVKIGTSVTVSVLEPDTLPRSVGKLLRIRDRRNEAAPKA